MAKTLVILGGETLLGRRLIELYLDSAWKVIVPVPGEKESLQGPAKARENLIQIPWNPSSLISAKMVFREGQKKFGLPDLAIIVNPEPAEETSAHLEDTAAMEQCLNSNIHGNLYLLKEIQDAFTRRGSGAMGFAETHSALTATAPLHTLISGAFHGLAEGILLEGPAGLLRTAFTSTLTEIEVYAQFIKGHLDSGDPKINGQWLRFSEKKTLFQTLPLVKRKEER